MFTHPSLSLLSDNFSRQDLFLVTYCLVDDWMQARFGRSNAPRQRRGPRPDEIADSEVITLLLVGELCHCQREAAWLRQIRASYGALFPALPSDGRFSRRAERVQPLLRPLRRALFAWADAEREPMRLMDSFPMPLCACYRIRQSSQPISGSTFGWNDAKRQYFFGLHPQLLITGSGFIEEIILAPGNCNDTPALAAYLDECVAAGRNLAGQFWVLDKGYRNRQIRRWAKEKLGLELLIRAQEARAALPSFWQATLDRVRKPIEGVIAVLCACFGIEQLRVKTDLGLYRRTQAKATAFSLGRYFNRALGLEPLNIARYAV